MSFKKIAIIFSSIALLIVIGIYTGKALTYQTKFLPKTMINDMDISNKTVFQVNKALQKSYRGKTFVATEGGMELFKFTGSDVGITDDFTESLTLIKDQQDQWSWPIRILKNKVQKEKLEKITYNKETFAGFFAGLPLVSANRIKPENAKIEKTESNFNLKPEVMGNTFDLDKVKASLIMTIESEETRISLDDYYQKPTIYKDNPELIKITNEANSLSKLDISYLIVDQKETISAERLFQWISLDAENNIVIDEDKVTSYLTELATKYSTKTKSRKFVSTKKGIVDVPPGIYGWTFLVNDEVNSLVADIRTKTNLQDREPKHEGSGYGVDIGKTYVEVDLTNQHMWFYKDGVVALETDVVTGKPTTPTPPGAFYIWNREPNAILRGVDYETPVKYWMPIDWDGVGIHDSNWQSAYGGNLYLTVGSHGCINTPPGVMEKLFAIAPVGTPVLVF